MTIDKKKVTPAGKDDFNEVTAMNVVGIERDGKDELVIAETQRDGKQYGNKEIMSTELTQGMEIMAANGGNPNKGMEVGE